MIFSPWKPFICNGKHLLYRIEKDTILVRKPESKEQVRIERNKSIPPEYNIPLAFDEIAEELEL